MVVPLCSTRILTVGVLLPEYADPITHGVTLIIDLLTMCLLGFPLPLQFAHITNCQRADHKLIIN